MDLLLELTSLALSLIAVAVSMYARLRPTRIAREKLLADFAAQAVAIAEQGARGLQRAGAPKQPGDVKKRAAVAWLMEQGQRAKLNLTEAEAAKRIELAVSGK